MKSIETQVWVKLIGMLVAILSLSWLIVPIALIYIPTYFEQHGVYRDYYVVISLMALGSVLLFFGVGILMVSFSSKISLFLKR